MTWREIGNHVLVWSGDEQDLPILPETKGKLFQCRSTNGILGFKTAMHDRKIGWNWFPEPKEDMTRARVGARITMHNIIVVDRRFRWSISVKKEASGLWFRIPTDCVGAREFLRERDKPVGGGRRASLLHWVRAHARKQRADDATMHDVQAYLRGSRICEWNGCLVQVRESEWEREDLANRDRRPHS